MMIADFVDFKITFFSSQNITSALGNTANSAWKKLQQ